MTRTCAEHHLVFISQTFYQGNPVLICLFFISSFLHVVQHGNLLLFNVIKRGGGGGGVCIYEIIFFHPLPKLQKCPDKNYIVAL